MDIDRVTRADDELLQAFERMVPQLTSKNPPPSLEDLQALVESESSTLFISRAEDGGITGAACVIVYRVPTGIRAIIEDVIVDETQRGKGIGEALVLRALEEARARGAAAVALTSNPRREAANRLYQRMGFVLRETNAYVYRLK